MPAPRGGHNSFVDHSPRTWIEIDLSALEHNLREVRRQLPADVRVALVAKADAYGHGIVPISCHAIETGAADWICVATVAEGQQLREAGITAPILLLSPILPDEAHAALAADLRCTVERWETAAALSQAAAEQKRRAVVHVEVDTGLARFGCKPEDALPLVQQILRDPHLEFEGLCQHYVDSGANLERTREQQALFQQVLDEFSKAGIQIPILHTSNSAGTCLHPEFAFDLVRVGILGYGIDPYGLIEHRERPVLRWLGKVIALREVQTGESLSYSETYRVQRPSVIATLALGYGDGYPRNLSSRSWVVLRDQRVPIVGLVCMDQLLIDVTDLENVEIGDVAVLIGNEIQVPEIAAWGETNCHEITTRIMPRVPRIYLHARSPDSGTR